MVIELQAGRSENAPAGDASDARAYGQTEVAAFHGRADSATSSCGEISRSPAQLADAAARSSRHSWISSQAACHAAGWAVRQRRWLSKGKPQKLLMARLNRSWSWASGRGDQICRRCRMPRVSFPMSSVRPDGWWPDVQVFQHPPPAAHRSLRPWRSVRALAGTGPSRVE
jgi:hypothetical protein